MGQAASYAESAIQRGLLRLKTEEKKKEGDVLALCGYQAPSTTSAEASPSSPHQRSAAGADERSSRQSSSPGEGSKTAAKTDGVMSPDELPTAPASWGPFVSLTPESYSIDELREALVFLPDSLWVSLNRISLLYVLDGDLDGEFGLNDIAHFTDWAIRVVPAEVSTDQLGEVVQAHAALECWHRCLVRGQQLREVSANLARSAGGPGRAGQHRQHRDRGGQSSLLVALTIADDLLRMAGGVTPQEAAQVAWAAEESSRASRPQLPPMRPLQSPVTKDDKLQASVHFGRWMLRLIHVQELARRRSGEQQRQRYREARRNTHERGTASGEMTPANGVSPSRLVKRHGGHRSPSHTPASQTSSSPSPASHITVAPPPVKPRSNGADGAMLKELMGTTPLLPPPNLSDPPISDVSPVRPSTTTAAATGDPATAEKKPRLVVKEPPMGPKAAAIIRRNRTKDIAAVIKEPPQSAVAHRDPQATADAAKDAAGTASLSEHPSQPTEDTADNQPYSSSEETDEDDPGEEDADGVMQLTEQEELVVDALLAQDVEFYHNLHASGWLTVGAVEEVYLDLAVRESYGLPFWVFCRKLHEQSAKEVEAALGLTPEEATRELISAVALEEARQRVALEYVETRRRLHSEVGVRHLLLATGEVDADDDDDVVCIGEPRTCAGVHSDAVNAVCDDRASPIPRRPPELPVTVPPIPSFVVSRYTLLCFLHCFIKAYWDVLENMGFDPLGAEAIHAAK